MSGRRLGPATCLMLGALAGLAAVRLSAQPQTLQAAALQTANPFETCATQVARAPERYESSLCYYEIAAQNGDWDSADALLGAQVQRHQEIAWLLLVRAYVKANLGDPHAAALYRQAAARFADEHNLRGELLARGSLSMLLFATGHPEESAREVARVAVLGRAARDPELKIRALVVEARHLLDTGRDLDRALRNLQRAQAALLPAHSYFLHRQVLSELGSLEVWLGRHDEAARHFKDFETRALQQGDLDGLALARVNIANANFERANEMPRARDRLGLLQSARVALNASRAAGATLLEVTAERLLAEMLLTEAPKIASTHVERCLELARALDDPTGMSECLSLKARMLAGVDARAARSLIRQSMQTLQAGQDTPRFAQAWRQQMRISWQSQPMRVAIADAERALLAIEALRDLQTGELGRVGVLSAWTRDYYWLSGQMLLAATSGEATYGAAGPFVAEDLFARAFVVAERMRSRALLDALAAAASRSTGSREKATNEPRAQRVLRSIVQTNQRLLGTISATERAGLVKALDEFERQARELDGGQLDQSGRLRNATRPASLVAVQAALAADEALLSFQIASRHDITGEFAGGAWLMVVTRSNVRAIPLPDRAVLADQVQMFLGLVRGAAEMSSLAASALHRALLRDALGGLPTGINTLIIVPDGPLHRLPIAALRTGALQRSVGQDYDITFVPSATLWLRWRDQPTPHFAQPAFVVADPRTAASTTARRAVWRNWSIDSGLRLGRLAEAEAEGRSVVQRAGAGSRLLVGRHATEASIKALSPRAFAVLHFATHAVIDEVHPERSAIVLAAADATDDGLLQSREISALHLDGQLVVLSSCQSATGATLRGEGVIGLARSFFAAGASAVVGSLWPVRDDYARAFFGPFYAALAEGGSVSDAVRSAQQSLIDDGYPVEAWAGFQVLGNGALIPLASTPSTDVGSFWSRPGALLALAAVCLALLAIAVVLARRYFVRQRSQLG